jgi:acyl carrier protein
MHNFTNDINSSNDGNTNLTVLQRIQLIVSELLQVDVAEVVPTASFTLNLGADSLDVVELVMKIEEEFGVEIEDGIASEIQTVNDVLKYFATIGIED